MSARCLYLDLDGTLLGRNGSLVHDGEGNVSLDGVRAVQACLRADVEVVLMSGRRRAQVFEDARLLGQASFIYEAGACVVLDGEEHWLTGELMPGELTIAEQIEASGAPAMLLEHYAGRLEYHEPWHVRREVSHLFRGMVDALEADALLAERGHADLRLVDNGVSTAARRRWRRSTTYAATTSCRRAPRRHRRWRSTARPATTSASRRSRWATRARTWPAPSTCASSGWWPMRSSATRRCAGFSRATRTCASPRPATARACTRRS